MDDHKLINGFRHVRYEQPSYPQDEMAVRVHEFYQWADSRRTVRDISERPVADTIIENLIRTASTAPSGAHKQPWTFCAVSNADIKRQIRLAAEKEEEESYTSRMSDRWIKDLKPLATDWHKPFLEKAPWLIVVFKKVYDLDDAGNKQNHYYVNESVGIACGLLITAIHHAGLVTLTHTPSPMNFLSDILRRPSNERPFLLLPVGYPEMPVYVPDLRRKEIDEIAAFYR